MTDATKTLSDSQLRLRALTALKQELGIADTLRFLALVNQNPTDYVEVSRQLYDGQTLDEIFDRAKQNWQA